MQQAYLSDIVSLPSQFITGLRAAMSASNVAQIHNLYTSSFARLTQEHYSQVEWPEVEVVQCLTDGNEVFGIFYKELYYRSVSAPHLRAIEGSL